MRGKALRRSALGYGKFEPEGGAFAEGALVEDIAISTERGHRRALVIPHELVVSGRGRGQNLRQSFVCSRLCTPSPESRGVGRVKRIVAHMKLRNRKKWCRRGEFDLSPENSLI